jgi:glutamyl/glutaminyl-tRNA synthetase
LLQEGKAYYCFCTKEELQVQRAAALEKGLTPKYNRKCLSLSKTEIQQKLKDGIPAVIRLKITDGVDIK